MVDVEECAMCGADMELTEPAAGEYDPTEDEDDAP
jgi:hypothetical protein